MEEMEDVEMKLESVLIIHVTAQLSEEQCLKIWSCF